MARHLLNNDGSGTDNMLEKTPPRDEIFDNFDVDPCNSLFFHQSPISISL